MRSTVCNRSVLAYSIAVVALFCSALFLTMPGNASRALAAGEDLGGVDFPGTGTGAIPDGSSPCPSFGSSLDISFAVTGVTAPLSDVALSHTISHTWVGDLDVRLIAPDATEHVIYSRVESASGDCFGDSSNLSGVYSFDDVGGPTNFWDAAFNAPGSGDIIANGNYRTTAAGPDDTPPADETDMTAAFSSVADPNGTWTLRVRDANGFDTGTVTEATLTLTGGVAPSSDATVDFNGDGTSDISIARDGTGGGLRDGGSVLTARSVREKMRMMIEGSKGENPGPTGEGPPDPGSNIDWYISNSGGGGPTISSFGEPTTDFVVPEDYDGDGLDDIAVWRPINATGPGGAFFMIFRSSDSTVDTVDFGVQNDDPTVVGDYDGDGTADPAVYRCPVAAPGQCSFYYLGSTNNVGAQDITVVPWGFGTVFTVFTNVGDFDGDGSHDFCVQTEHPNQPGQGLFSLLRSSDFGVEYFAWGLNTDLIAPGDYDGDGMNDFTVVRNEGGQLVWYILEKDGGTRGAAWGLASDFATPADYDGDGATDVAVYRGSEGNWYLINSGSGMSSGYDWGEGGAGDYPLSNFQVH
ncbi:MAG: hypothetical protein DWQ47_06515 [Acidobacteria bacterium]|nr:MAG: hypothetical protein DWQ32_10065 [Acidobacteriota bacterium]REK02026.1 MAG: hypothetical protein DWQ38_06495 [Acidobacteriota bacterium]REK14984.1 MAG: hypothetical protein DWQ43_15755 [Acidobacteriota bacterium]REK45698.1 MAG: hypothetical protein DWQ47_06515 [Acidobacteriota bacterium]